VSSNRIKLILIRFFVLPDVVEENVRVPSRAEVVAHVRDPLHHDRGGRGEEEDEAGECENDCQLPANGGREQLQDAVVV
jgi:hypothetical protein